MYKTRKLVFTAFAAILASFLVTCVPFGPPDDYDEDEITYTDVEYSQDGSSVTIYLDGSAPVRHTRALTLENAKLGHDLFEVAFAYRNTSGQTAVARAVWETGHAAGINGVYRAAPGVDYSQVQLVNTMPNDSGSAIMFVGKKSDRTLLAVGKLSQVDGLPANPGDPIPPVTTTTKTVTFSVAALKAGVNSTASFSSFKTDAKRPSPPAVGFFDDVNTNYTKVDNVIIGDKPFPLFWLDPSPRYVHGEYQFDDVTGNFNEYRNGILQKSNIELLYPELITLPNRIPRYPFLTETGEYGRYRTSLDNTIAPKYEIDGSTPVTAPQNAGPGTPFNNPVRFTIGTTSGSMEKHVFAFTFQIPVYPLTGLDNRNTEFSWFLRPGYDSYNYDLDDGMGGTGGAILLGTGDFETVSSSNLYVYKPPDKTRYNGTGGANAWLFDPGGIEVYLRTGGSVEAILTNMWFVVTTPSGERALLTGNNIQALLSSAAVNGIVTVTVEYYPTVPDGEGDRPFTETGTPPNAYGVRNSAYDGSLPVYTTTFNLYYLNLPAGVNFDAPSLNRYAITNSEDFNRVHNGHPESGRPGISGSNGGVFLIAVFHNFNFPTTINLKAGQDHTILFVAGRPDIIIGIDSATSGNNAIFANDNGNNFYYIGIWPFDAILSAEGMAFESYPFYINPTGRWEDVPVGPDGKPTGTNPPNNTGRWFVSGTNGTKTVYHAGVTVFNIGQIAQPPATILP